MLLPLIGLCLGAIGGLLFPQHIPAAYSQFVAVAIIAAFDSSLGGFNAKLKGTYEEWIFISGFICNALFAVLLAWLGKMLGLDLYLAAILVFGSRMLQNIAEIRRYLLKNRIGKDKIISVANIEEENDMKLE